MKKKVRSYIREVNKSIKNVIKTPKGKRVTYGSFGTKLNKLMEKE